MRGSIGPWCSGLMPVERRAVEAADVIGALESTLAFVQLPEDQKARWRAVAEQVRATYATTDTASRLRWPRAGTSIASARSLDELASAVAASARERMDGEDIADATVALSVLAIGLYVFQGTLDVLRGQALVRLGSRLDRRLAPLAHNAVVALPLAGASPTAALQPLRDIDAMRAFLASQGPVALLELPWIPAYIAFVFLLHLGLARWRSAARHSS